MLYIRFMGAQPDVLNHLRRMRRRADLTQEEVAERVGVSRQTIISIERGRYNPSIGLALSLARAFDVPVEELFELPGGGSDA